MQEPGPHLIGDLGQVDTNNDNNCRQAVLNTYTTSMRTWVLREQNAFDAAVRVYLAHSPDASVTAARRAVASVICGKL